jgi:hypothetical protein
MTQANLLEQIYSGANRGLQVLAASGLVPLPPEEIIPIQVALVSSPDVEIAGKAAEALANVDPQIGSTFLLHHAGESELRYFGLHVAQPALVNAVIQRRDTPPSLLAELASIVPPEQQERLVLRQDAILEEPQILVALEKNPQVSSYTKRRIWEYREHLLPKDKVPPKTAEEIQAEAEALTEEEIQEAFEEVKGKAKEGKTEDSTGLTVGQLLLLPVPMRVKLARRANQQIRAILIRDSSSQVALAVMNGNSLTDQEVEHIASSRSVVKEVLDAIPRKREWIRKYSVAKALVKNPRVQLATALKLVPRMSKRDLRELARDKNIPDGVRSVSLRLYNARS